MTRARALRAAPVSCVSWCLPAGYSPAACGGAATEVNVHTCRGEGIRRRVDAGAAVERIDAGPAAERVVPVACAENVIAARYAVTE